MKSFRASSSSNFLEDMPQNLLGRFCLDYAKGLVTAPVILHSLKGPYFIHALLPLNLKNLISKQTVKNSSIKDMLPFEAKVFFLLVQETPSRVCLGRAENFLAFP